MVESPASYCHDIYNSFIGNPSYIRYTSLHYTVLLDEYMFIHVYLFICWSCILHGGCLISERTYAICPFGIDSLHIYTFPNLFNCCPHATSWYVMEYSTISWLLQSSIAVEFPYYKWQLGSILIYDHYFFLSFPWK